MATARRRVAAARHAELVCFVPGESELQILSPRLTASRRADAHLVLESASAEASRSKLVRAKIPSFGAVHNIDTASGAGAGPITRLLRGRVR